MRGVQSHKAVPTPAHSDTLLQKGSNPAAAAYYNLSHFTMMEARRSLSLGIFGRRRVEVTRLHQPSGDNTELAGSAEPLSPTTVLPGLCSVARRGYLEVKV